MIVVWLSIASALFFALTFLFRKLAVKTIPSVSVLLVEVAVELLIIAAIFLVLLLNNRGESFTFKAQGVKFAIWAGIMVALGVGANILALKSGNLSKVMSVQLPTQVILGVALGLMIFSEALAVKQIIGIILAVIGIVLVVN